MLMCAVILVGWFVESVDYSSLGDWIGRDADFHEHEGEKMERSRIFVSS